MKMADHSMMKLGKKAPRHDRRTLLLAKYLDPALVPPAKVDWSKAISTLGMMGNDAVGDCTCAAACHLKQTWTANNGLEVTTSDGEILKAYEDVGGYRPGDPTTDNGCVELDVLNYWRQIGIGGDKIYAYTALKIRSKSHVKLAIDLFGGITIGLSLPITAQSQQDLWWVTTPPNTAPDSNAAPGSWGGHEVAVIGYDSSTLTFVTWGKIMRMTWAFFFTYCDEGYAVLSQDWVNGTKQAPSGFTFAQLQTDLFKVVNFST
jgi:hypothetical protein